MTRRVNELILRRLPRYMFLPRHFKTEGMDNVSAMYLSVDTGIHPSQIRKDLGLVGFQGMPKSGHHVNEAINNIEELLNWRDNRVAFLAGVGSLGRALLNYNNFSNTGLQIVAAFDINEDLHGTEINEIKIFPLSRFADLAKRMHINVGIITTPRDQAQSVADLMIENGVSGIWNFSRIKLRAPENVIIENIDLYEDLGFSLAD
ncbi:MAG: redox-sensing transcriptional repressor Rex [Candidatus Cloacimonetes bacterium]|nr:redox-sensing transcriptional repressor Rex [Candidatus Cloacimonadota bacterium]